MAVQFILGASGTGKTEYLYETVIREAREHRSTTYYFIVPEQFTLETQKNLVSRHPAHGIANIDVISLARLAQQVFSELGGQRKTILKDIGKSMVIRRVLNLCESQLQVFGVNARQTGFVEEAKSLVSELYQYGVDEETLLRLLEENKDQKQLCKKLNDVLIIYKEFQRFMGEHYLTSEGIYDVLAECIDDTDRLSDCVVILDGFTGFTPSQYALLRKLMSRSKKLYLALTLEKRVLQQIPQEHELFYMSYHTYHKMQELAREVECEVLTPIFPEDGSKQRRLREGSMLSHMERNIFRYPVQMMTVGEEPELTVFSAKNAKEECRYVVTEAARLIREQGYRYRDIAVICSDITEYGESLSEEFTRAGLPNFLDYKKNMSENQCAAYVRAILNIAEQGITTEGILSYTKNALSGYETEDIWTLENYLISTGIKGYQWKKEWKRTYSTHTEVSLEQLNALRIQLLEEMTPMIELFHKEEATVREWTTALFYFLRDHGLEHKLAARAEDFSEKGERLAAREYAQLYRVLLDLFDQLVELLGEERLSAKEYRELVETGLHEAKVGLIPEGSEQIVIGDMERTRLKEIRALFFVGVNDGKIPATGNGKGILSDKDRKQLAVSQVELAPDMAKKACFGQYYLYLNITKPTDALYFTYAGVSSDGKTLRTSYLIGKLLGMFRGLTIRTEFATVETGILKDDKGKQAFLAEYRKFASGEASEEFGTLYQWHQQQETPEVMEQLYRAALAITEQENITGATARELYGEKLVGSVTRMEQFAACAFAHYLKYGLRLEERQEYSLKAPDIGNLYHDSLKRYGEELDKRGKKWLEVTGQEREELIRSCAKRAVEEFAGDIFKSSEKNAYLAGRMEQTLVQTVEVLTKQLENSDFVPAGFEQKFYHTDRDMSLYGVVDRYDIYKEDGKQLLKIVDYKSSDKNFEPDRFYYGLTMQLAVYMTAMLEKIRKESSLPVEPAAMFYYHVDDPMVDKCDDPKAEITKKLRVKGLVCSDNSSITHLDRDFADAAGGFAASVKSVRIPVETDKEGNLKANSMVADRKQFSLLSEHVYDKLRQECEEILGGEVGIEPYRLGKKNACTYCGFASVCGFDRKNGSTYRTLEPMGKTQVWEKLRKEKETEDGGN